MKEQADALQLYNKFDLLNHLTFRDGINREKVKKIFPSRSI